MPNLTTQQSEQIKEHVLRLYEQALLAGRYGSELKLDGYLGHNRVAMDHIHSIGYILDYPEESQ
jgi:hypothetical protein